MKTKNLVLVSALGFLCAVVGLFRYWALVSLAFAAPGLAVGNRLNVDAWISFTTGSLGVALLVSVGIAYAVSKRKTPNQSLEPTAPSGRGSSLTLGIFRRHRR